MSFKVAADELSVTPSAISHQVRNFESYLGCKLFVRGTRKVELTIEGQRLYADLRGSVAEIEAAVQRLRSCPDRIPLRLEMPAFFSSELFLPRIPEFSARHRHIDLRIQTTAPNDSQSRQADLNIVLSTGEPVAACVTKLFPLHYQPACSASQFNDWRDKTPEDLQQATLIVHEARPKAWQQWFAEQEITLQTPQQTITVDSMYGLARATQRGAGVALIPVPVSQSWFDSGQLAPLFDSELMGTDSYWLTCTEPVQEQSVRRVLWDWIVAEFALEDEPIAEKA